MLVAVTPPSHPLTLPRHGLTIFHVAFDTARVTWGALVACSIPKTSLFQTKCSTLYQKGQRNI
jgi:hypothetical protein